MDGLLAGGSLGSTALTYQLEIKLALGPYSDLYPSLKLSQPKLFASCGARQ